MRRLAAIGLLAALTIGYGARVAEEALSAHPFNPVAFVAGRYRAARSWVERQLAPPSPSAGQFLVSGSTPLIFQSYAPIAEFYEGGATLLTLYGSSGTAIATVHRDGRVDLAGDPNEAARVFWEAVGLAGAKNAVR